MRKGILFIIFLSIEFGTVQASDQILLKSRHFTPQRGISEIFRSKMETIPDRVHVILQLDYIPTRVQRKKLDAKEIELLSFVPDKAWFASIPTNKISEIVNLYGVRAITEILPEDKIAPSIRNGGVSDYSNTEKGQAKLIVFFFDDVQLSDAYTTVLDNKGSVLDVSPILNIFVIHLPKDKIYELAGKDCVKWINQHYEAGPLNDGAREATHVNEVQGAPYDLTGTDVNIGVWDGGCDDED